MHVPERRKTERFTVKFRTSFSVGKMLAGEGVITDISIRGCRVVCTTALPKDTPLEMRIDFLDQKPPVEIESAIVRWAKGKECGIEFLSIEPQSFDRLKRFTGSFKQASTSHQKE